ncbi:hypothetical protein [Bradyrhizobium japonicum]|uniref:hypothetical protein n=1 Tax=Bradyrhizobium japonicum TaxID=375 RepID=UPI001E3F23CC|nr:hypothetical protein [Bradyrhizobium japonicum]MCD9821233.1 hypothetical protein [Bradyrhizobium japonicum]MEB2674071.1 hypothetical protein [Bradyrhizobium japonicum]WRI93257.1 hypothetical protein R3F75_20930 [Bradyrhizobium japonicum]
MITKNQRIETLRDAFAKAATANDPEALQLVGRELLAEYDQQPKLSKLHQDHRTIVEGMLVTLMSMAELQKGDAYASMTPEQRERLQLDVGLMAMDMLLKKKQ